MTSPLDLAVAAMALFDDPQHDAGGWQYFMQNEYHLGLIKTSAIPAQSAAAFGDLQPKTSSGGQNVLQNLFDRTNAQ